MVKVTQCVLMTQSQLLCAVLLCVFDCVRSESCQSKVYLTIELFSGCMSMCVSTRTHPAKLFSNHNLRRSEP